MTPQPPSDVWIHDRAIVGPSSIEGRGLFAVQSVSADDVVLRLGGRIVSSKELGGLIALAERDPSVPYVDTIIVDDDVHLVLPPKTLAHFANHSCDPTLWHIGAFDLVARRDIRPGEELTVDYGTSSGAKGFTMPCNCGSPACRGEITSEDWRRADLQVRYRGHWVPALEERIRRARQSPPPPD